MVDLCQLKSGRTLLSLPHAAQTKRHAAIEAASKVARNNPALISLGDTAQIADEKSRVPRSGKPHNEPAGANAGGFFFWVRIVMT